MKDKLEFVGEFMNDDIKLYIEKYPDNIINMFNYLRKLILEVNPLIEEKMWAKLPTFYLKEAFVRLIPFKDHINIEAKTIITYKDELTDFKITPKGMLQIFINQDVPSEILKKVFADTLLN